MARAEKFAEKVGGTVRMDSKGKPVVGYGGKSPDGNGAIVKTEKKFGDFSTWKNVGQTLGGFFKALDGGGTNLGNGDGEYTGANGLKNFGKDFGKALGKGSTYVKAGGVIAVAGGVLSGQPEVVGGGVAAYRAGDTMDKISTGVLITTDIADKNGRDAVVRGVAFGVGQMVGTKIDSGISDEAAKTAATYVVDQTIDAAKEQSLTKEKDE